MVNSRKIKVNAIGLVCACASLLIFSECSRETSLAEKVNTPVSEDFESAAVKRSKNGVFHKSVGGPIKKETGTEWIENYKKKKGKSFTYTFESTVFSKILADPLAEGIVMYYGVTGDGIRHVLPIGIQYSGKLIKTDYVTTESGDIKWEEAIHLIDSYSGPIRSHFFGANAFNRLITEQKAKKILGTSALDSEGDEQFLLSLDGTAETQEYLDRSAPCPPHCNSDQDIINSLIIK